MAMGLSLDIELEPSAADNLVLWTVFR